MGEGINRLSTNYNDCNNYLLKSKMNTLYSFANRTLFTAMFYQRDHVLFSDCLQANYLTLIFFLHKEVERKTA